MITISQAVEKLVAKSPYLEDAISDNLVNLSELARQLQPEIEEILFKDINQGGIVMALKRLKPRLSRKKFQGEKVLNDLGDITVKSDLVEFTFGNSPTLVSKIKKLFDYLEVETDRFITLSQGMHETSIIVSKKLTSKLKELAIGEQVIAKFSDLSAIIIKLPPMNVQVPGVYYLLMKAFAWQNVNIVDMVSTSNEITLFFADKDIEQAFAVAKRIKN